MADETNDVQGDPSVGDEAEAEPTVEAVPAWFSDFAGEMRGKIGELGKDSARMRALIKKAQTGGVVQSSGPEATSAASNQQNSGAQSGDLKELRDLMRAEAKLGDEQIEWLDQNSEGLSLQERGRLVNALNQGAPANGKKLTSQKSNTTRAANAAQRTSAEHPRNMAELSALADLAFGEGNPTAKAKWERIKSDPTFRAEFD